ncbi:MAG TPA: hypothetical protein DDZ51_03235 [Planctomycetaceae bacterium]|nr:hypothetical protein [Planctomycetaceae bacterium]
MSDGSSWNPYEVHPSADLRTTGEDDLKNLTILATILLSMSMLTFTLCLGAIAFNIAMGIGFGAPPGFDPNNIVAFRMGQIGSVVLPMFCQLLTIFGSVAMIARKKLGIAWAGAVAGLFPLCGPCLGLSLPFAIWAMILLQRPGVIAAFRT